MIPIEVLVRPIESDALFEIVLDGLEAVEVPARSWRDGGTAKTILSYLAEIGSQGSKVLADCIGGMFLLFAKGNYLTAHAKDVYDVDRIAATFATGEVTLTNAGGAIYTIGANELIARSSNTGARYRITEGFTLGASTSITVEVSAIEAGSASSVGVAEIDELETPLAKVTVTNEATIEGRDAESDELLVKRCLLKKGTWSPFGPRDAYEYAALTATLPDGSPTSITRVAVSRFSSTGIVTVVCATPTGTPTSDELDAVRTECERIARADSATLVVEGAVPVATAHVVTLWARGGSEPVIEARALAAIAKLIAEYPIGGNAKSSGGQGYLFSDAIAAAAISSSAEAFDVDFDDAADIELEPNEVATNTTTIEVRQP